MKLFYTIAKIIGALVVITSAVYGSITFVFKKGIESERKNNQTVVLETKVERLIIADSIKVIDDFKFKREMLVRTKVIADSMHLMAREGRASKRILQNHIINTATKDDIQNMVNEYEKKNPDYLFWINKDTTQFGTVLGLKK